MKYVFMLVLLISAVAIAQGTAVVCKPDACFTVRCAQQTNVTCPDGVIVEKGGYCGCCDGCLTKVPKGKDCSELKKSTGERPTSACEPGTTCQKSCHGTWTCQK